jgi:hypothetical protein
LQLIFDLSDKLQDPVLRDWINRLIEVVARQFKPPFQFPSVTVVHRRTPCRLSRGSLRQVQWQAIDFRHWLPPSHTETPETDGIEIGVLVMLWTAPPRAHQCSGFGAGHPVSEVQLMQTVMTNTSQ